MKNKYFEELQPHIVEKFFKYHNENPHVYGLVKRFAYEAKNSGRTRFGIKMIWERMRWYMTIETNDDKFKLCNDYHSCYARLLMTDDPSFEKFFQRKVTNKQQSLL